MVLTVSFGLFPVIGLVVTVIGGIASTNLTPASRRQNHTTSPSASVPFVSGTSASIASRPAFVTIASRPSWWNETAALIILIWVFRERKYFCKWGWTGNRSRSLSGKSARHFAR